MTYTNGLQVGVGFDVARHSGGSNPARHEFWQALIARIDGAVDFVTLEDGFGRAEGDGLDAVLLANWLAPRSKTIGIIAGAPVNFQEPFHVSTSIATLDFVSEGRAGLLAHQFTGSRARIAGRAIGALTGFPAPESVALKRDTQDAIEVIRRLWDSWEDEAVIRDRDTHRFLDGSKLHYIKFEGAGFHILGPSITPRPPQGQPVVAVAYHDGDDPASVLAADVVFLDRDVGQIAVAVDSIRDASLGTVPALLADIVIGERTGSIDELLSSVRGIAQSGAQGIRFVIQEPIEHVAYLIDEVLPALRAASHVRPAAGGTLRERFGLPQAGNRYTSAA
jgi:hypothetical protein